MRETQNFSKLDTKEKYKWIPKTCISTEPKLLHELACEPFAFARNEARVCWPAAASTGPALSNLSADRRTPISRSLCGRGDRCCNSRTGGRKKKFKVTYDVLSHNRLLIDIVALNAKLCTPLPPFRFASLMTAFDIPSGPCVCERNGKMQRGPDTNRSGLPVARSSASISASSNALAAAYISSYGKIKCITPAR